MTAARRSPRRTVVIRFASRLAARLGGALLVVWGAATAGFVALRMIPGDPVDVMLGVHAQVGEGVRAQIRADWGLDQPPLVQYFEYLGRLVRGDLGQSYQLRTNVVDVIGQQALPTIQLTALALLFALVLAFCAAALVRGRRAKRVVSLLELFVISSPTFWIGLVLLAVFAFQLRWFPVAATQGLSSLILPALTLALPIAGIISQVLRQGLDAAETQQFATTARARGVGQVGLVLRHSLRHAAADSLTLTGYLVGSLLGGAVLVETVFARQGLGGVAIRAIVGRDLPVVLGVIVYAAIVFALVNLVVDLLYERIDPRLRSAGRLTAGSAVA